MFAEVLGVPEPSAEEGFFALGGDSILSMQLVSRARTEGLSLTPRQVFQHQTPPPWRASPRHPAPRPRRTPPPPRAVRPPPRSRCPPSPPRTWPRSSRGFPVPSTRCR
ncbi:phosphopantetheine-binding protein [Streptomyces rapamycinicus]|uniref:phosphopantetheine-binding protein n=1 Tax=Streptomyces rapamycinicus TaxID=1226757 RepID=UPI003CCDCFEC